MSFEVCPVCGARGGHYKHCWKVRAVMANSRPTALASELARVTAERDALQAKNREPNDELSDLHVIRRQLTAERDAALAKVKQLEDDELADAVERAKAWDDMFVELATAKEERDAAIKRAEKQAERADYNYEKWMQSESHCTRYMRMIDHLRRRAEEAEAIANLAMTEGLAQLVEMEEALDGAEEAAMRMSYVNTKWNVCEGKLARMTLRANEAEAIANEAMRVGLQFSNEYHPREKVSEHWEVLTCAGYLVERENKAEALRLARVLRDGRPRPKPRVCRVTRWKVKR